MMRKTILRGVSGAAAVVALVTVVWSAVAQPAPPRASVDKPRDGNGGPSMMPRSGGPGPGGAGEAPGGGRPNADPMQMLVNSAQLQAELKIEPDQLRKLKTIEGEFRSKQAEILMQIDQSSGETQKESARRALHAHQEVGRGMVARVLARPQLDRLQQIMMQIEGACSAVRDENVAEGLRLEPPQMKQIGDLCKAMFAGMEPVSPSASRAERCAAQEQARRKIEKAREKTEAEIAKVMTEGQRAGLRAMSGRPFKMDAPRPPECQ